MSTKHEPSIPQETVRKRYIKGFSPQRFQLPQIAQPIIQQTMSVRQRGKSLSNSQREPQGFLSPKDFIRLLKSDHQLGQEFCYLNNFGNPYEWKVVNYQDRNEEYYMTISARGIIIHNDDSEEFLTIQQFERDRKLFYQLQKIEFFRTYLMSKTYSRWRKLSIKNKSQNISKELISNYLLLDPSLKKPIEEINKYICRIKGLTFFTPSQIGPLCIEKFNQRLQRSLDNFQKDLQNNINFIIKITSDACQYSFSIFKEDQGYRQNLEMVRNSQMEQKPLIIGDNSTQAMPFTMESNLRVFQQKLIKFIRVVDYVQMECLIDLMYSSIVNFLKIIKHANQHTKVGATYFSWVVIDIHLEQGAIVYHPSCLDLRHLFTQTISKSVDIIENSIASGRRQPEMQSFGIGAGSSDLKLDLREYGRSNLKDLSYSEYLEVELQYSYKQITNYVAKIQKYLDDFYVLESGGFNVEMLKEQFSLIAEVLSETEVIENIVDIGLLRLNIQMLKQEMQIYFKDKIRIINGKVQSELEGKSKYLLEIIQDWLDKLKLKPVTLKQYVQYQEYYTLIKKDYDSVDQQIEEIHAYNRVYSQEEQTVPQAVKEVWDKIISLYQLFQYKYYDLQNQYGLVQDKFEKEFRRITPHFHQKVLLFCDQFESNKDIDDINSIKQLQGQLNLLDLEYIDLQTYSEALMIEKYQNEQLTDIREKYKQFRELQFEIHRVRMLQQEWLREHFLDLNMDIIKQNYSQLLQKIDHLKIFGQAQLLSIQKELITEQKLYSVIEIISQIKNFDATLVGQVCKKDRLQDKNLLQLIMQISNNPQHPTFTTQYLFQLDISESLEAFQQLLTTITYENQIMNQLLILEDFWKNHKLVVQKVKGTKDQYLITNLIQLEEQLDENVLIINNILGQPNIEDIKVRIDTQLKNITYLQEYLQQLKSLQETQQYLANVLSTQINQKNQSKEMKMYQQQEKQWKQLVRQVQQQKNLEIWIKDEKMLKQIQQDNQNCKLIISSLNEQFEKKKYLFPRFNFLTNSQFSKVVSEVKHPAAMQHYLSLFFQNIHQFDYDPVKEAVTALYSSNNEQLVLKYCPMKGEIEDWFRTIEEGMRQGLRQVVKNATKHGDNYQQIVQFPIQVIYICMGISYTTILEDMLQNEERDWNELFEFKKYEISEQIKHLHEEKSSVKQQLRQVAIIAILNSQLSAVEEIQQFNMTSEKDYFFQKQQKYYLDDDSVIFSCLGNKINYQYEYYGDEFNYLHWKQSDQCLIAMHNCFSISRMPNLIGDISKYYIITQYAQILGRYYKQFQVTEANYDFMFLLQCVYGAIQTNSLLILSGFNLLQQTDKLILQSLFDKIAISYSNSMQIQDMEGRAIRIQNKYFLACVSEQAHPILSFKNICIFKPELRVMWNAFIQMIYPGEIGETLCKLLIALESILGDQLLSFPKLQKLNMMVRTLKVLTINDLCELLQYDLQKEERNIFHQILEDFFPNTQSERFEFEQLCHLLNEDHLLLVYGPHHSGKTKLIQDVLAYKQEKEAVQSPEQPVKQNIILELGAYDDEDLPLILEQQFQYYHLIMDKPYQQIIYQPKCLCFQNRVTLQNRNVLFESSNIKNQDPSIVANFTLFYYCEKIPLTMLLDQELKFLNNQDFQQLLSKHIVSLILNLKDLPYDNYYIVRCAAKVLSVYYNEQQFGQYTQLDVENISTYTVYMTICLITDEDNRKRLISTMQTLIQERKLDQLFNHKGTHNHLQYYFNQQELYVLQQIKCDIIFYGGVCCRKTTLANMRSSLSIFFNKSSKSSHLQDFLDKKLMTYRKDRQLCISPPFGQVRYFVIEDINMSQQGRVFLKQLTDQNYMFDRKNNYQMKHISSVYFIGTSQESQIKNYNQFRSYLFVNCNRTELVQNIYAKIYLDRNISAPERVIKFMDSIHEAIVKLKHKCEQHWKLTPSNPHFQFNHNIWLRILNIPLQEPSNMLTAFHSNIMRIIGGMLDIEDFDQLDKYFKEYDFGEHILDVEKYQKLDSHLFLHESHIQKIISIMRGFQNDQHVVLIGKPGVGKNSFVRLACSILGYQLKFDYIDQPNSCCLTKLTEEAYQIISYPMLQQIHLCIIVQNAKELQQYPRIVYKCQIVHLFDWPKGFYMEVAHKIINDRSIDCNSFYKVHEHSKGYLQQYLDSLTIFEKQYQLSKADNTRLVVIYSKVLQKIEEANKEFSILDEQLNKFIKDNDELNGELSKLSADALIERQEQSEISQQVFRLSENIAKSESKIHKQQSQLHQQYQQLLKQRADLMYIILDFDCLTPLTMDLIHLMDLPPLELQQLAQIEEKYPKHHEQIQQLYSIAINVGNYQSTLIGQQNTLHNDRVQLEELRTRLELKSLTGQQLEKQSEILSQKQKIIQEEIGKLDRIHSVTAKCLKHLNVYQLEWQQNIFTLQQQQTQLIDQNLVLSLSQAYQIEQKLVDDLHIQGKLDYEDMHLLLGLKYQQTGTMLIIDPESLAQDFICQYYPTAKIEPFNVSTIDTITDPQQCYIIKDVIISELMESHPWRSFILQKLQIRVFLISCQIRPQKESYSLLRTIYFRKQDKEIESLVLLHILQFENIDLFDRVIQQFDEENLNLVNLGPLLDDDKPLMDTVFEKQLSLLISSQFGSIMNFEIMSQIQEIVNKQEEQKQLNAQFNFEVYHPLIVRFVLIYKSLQQAHLFDRRYYITLQQLIDKLLQIVAQIKGENSERYWIISNHFTQSVLSLIDSSMKPEHNLIAKFLVFTQIDLRNRTILHDQYQYLIGAPVNKDLSKYPKHVQLIKNWDEVKYLMSLSPSFEDLHLQINRYPKEWLKFIEDTHSIPKEYDEKLQIFEKLLLVKALKPHYIRRFLIEYVQDRAMRHSTQNKVIKSMTTEKQIIFMSPQMQRTIEEINLPKYKGEQELTQAYLIVNLSSHAPKLQQLIIESKYPHCIVENYDDDLLLDKTLLNCQKTFLHFADNIRTNLKTHIPKVTNSTSEVKRFTYSLCYAHFLLVQRASILNQQVPYYSQLDLQLLMNNLPLFLQTNTNSIYRILSDGIYNLPTHEIQTMEAIIYKHCNSQVNSENYQYLHFQTLPIGSDVWLDEMINRIPETGDTYSVGLGVLNQVVFHKQNEILMQQFSRIIDSNLKPYSKPLPKLPEPLIPIKLEQKLNRKNSFHKNDSKPFSQHYRKTALSIVSKKAGTQYIDALDQFLNIQIQKYNTLLQVIKDNGDYKQYLWQNASNTTLHGIIDSMTINMNQIRILREQQIRKFWDLSIFYNPASLFEYFKLQFARKNGLGPWNLNLYTDISKISEINHVQQQQMNDGSYLIGGLECINCQWNAEKHKLTECILPNQSLPFLLVTTLEGVQTKELHIPVMDGNKELFTVELPSDLDQETLNIRQAKLIIKRR